MSRVVNNNRGFLQLLADCPAYQRQFLTRFVPHAITRFPRGEITSLPTPHFYCFPSTTITTTTTTATTFLLFSLHHHNHLISIVFPPRNFIRDYQLPFLIHFVAMPRVVNNNSGFLQLLADFPAYQHRFRRCH